jgi:predicted Rossmann fold flavoprotein
LERYDVVVIGAGAAGMMCAIEAGNRGRSVLVIDHAKAAGEKIRISGGGRCNFTNVRTQPANFTSRNPHFCISALSRYTPAHFIALVERHAITWHEKTLGQLFCDHSSRQIVDMLLREMKQAGATLRLQTTVDGVATSGYGFELASGGRRIACEAVVVATGGKSIPKMGATGWGYDIARQFGLEVTDTKPGLVPLTFEVGMLGRLKPLVGIAVDVRVKCDRATFDEAMLFTHRGLSGPAILQISSWWREGEAIEIDMAPAVDIFEVLRTARAAHGKQAVQTVLGKYLPNRLAQFVAETGDPSLRIGDASDKALSSLAAAVNRWRVKPVGTEGYRTAEVTTGGVDTSGLDQKTMAARNVPRLYFVGEVVDVTGWLGGYNFQWAWASGWAAGQAV